MTYELSVENERDLLVADLNEYPLALKDPIGNNLTYLKIQKYIYACILGGIDKSDCVDWLFNLYASQTEDERNKFSSQIDLIANALYNFYTFLNKLANPNYNPIK